MNKNFLQLYADFAVNIGVNPQKCQTMIINSPIACADFARMCAKSAYAAGAKNVIVHYNDEQLSRIQMESSCVEVLEDIKPWICERYLQYIESEGGACLLSISSRDPEIYKGLDADKVNRADNASHAASKPWRKYTLSDKMQWCIVAVPSPSWAKMVFPNEANPEEALWDAIFEVCRVKGGNPVAEWRAHVENTIARKNKLNEMKLDYIHMTSKNGTDVKIGLANNAEWEGASSRTPEGYEFIANVPTEEVFTAPHKDRVNGVVKGTKPYVYNGNLIDDFTVRFENGRVVEFSARKGEELLKQLLETDDGSKSIGEIALVPASSPINKLNILFYNTLFDENAACHIAFGAGYPGSVSGGREMTESELFALGVNKSLIHEDVMIGSADMDITGYDENGKAFVLFKNGEWAI